MSQGNLQVDIDVIDIEWERLVLRMAVAQKKSVGQILMDQARLAVREMANVLPPMGTLTGRETWAAQRRLQIKAINRDVSRVYITRSRIYQDIKVDEGEQVAAAWWHATIHDPIRAQQMLGMMSTRRRWLPIGRSPDPSHHTAARRRGRVPESEQGRQIVLDSRRLLRYRSQQHRKIGRLKGGMIPAATRIGATGIPAWVRRNAGPGLVVVQNENTNDPSIRIANLVSYAQVHNRGNRLMRIVIGNRRAAMQRGLQGMARRLARGG